MEKIDKKFNPKVSIVIPVYNGVNYMREAIDSALAQTYNNIEVIVVNDGSTDDTEKIVLSYGSKIKYFYKENGGVASALNLAIEKSEGDYISWLSHDDVYYLNKIESQIKKLSELKEIDRMNSILMSNYSLINEKSQFISNQEFHKTHDLEKLNYPLYPLLKGLIHGCTLLIPKKCFVEVGYFDPKLKTTQDYDLWFKMFPKYKMIFMSEVLVKSRWHSEQGSKKINIANQEANELWIGMIKNLTDEQKRIIDGSVLSFYQKTIDLVKNVNYLEAEKYLLGLIDEIKKRDISKIKISIIIPFYNRIEWTIEAVNSVITQTHRNIEIILVNDFSTENIKPIMDVVHGDKRIKYILNRNQKGVSGARNTGLDNLQGEYVTFLDSDDLFLPNKISKQIEFMVREGFVFSHTSYSLFTNIYQRGEVIKSGVSDYKYPSIISGCSIATPTVMIHSDLVKNIRFPENYSIGEDICFWIALSRISFCKGLDDDLTRVRRHSYNAAYDIEKQILGVNNVLNFVISNYLGLDIFKEINKLNFLLLNQVNYYYKKDNTNLVNEDNFFRIEFKYFFKKKLRYLFSKGKNYISLKHRDLIRKKFSYIFSKIYS